MRVVVVLKNDELCFYKYSFRSGNYNTGKTEIVGTRYNPTLKTKLKILKKLNDKVKK